MNKLEIHLLLKRQWPNACVHIPDKDYFLPSEYKIWDEIVSSYFEDYKYQSQIMDCDDYSLLLHAWIRQQQYRQQWSQPLAFGEVWSKTHALNFVILDDKTIKLIEPQNDKLLNPNTYDINFVRM
jgi:hypothetical protein